MLHLHETGTQRWALLDWKAEALPEARRHNVTSSMIPVSVFWLAPYERAWPSSSRCCILAQEATPADDAQLIHVESVPHHHQELLYWW